MLRHRPILALLALCGLGTNALGQCGFDTLQRIERLLSGAVDAVAQFAVSPNSKTILFPVEATSLIGTLGGIGELAKDALAKDK